VGPEAITKRFPLGSYIQIDEEIMRVASRTLSTPSGGTVGITVIRGALATRQVSHDSGSLIRKIKPISIEFRRPSIVRASGHTFEYLGYGPGNYSTGLPQVQSITLTEREEFLVQSQERSGGIVVYTGMNNNGDSFIGNRKTSSSTGEEVTFDNPIPTITGEDPSRLSAVFDEVTVKERLVVEGGNSGTILSQFDGPVTFNKGVKFSDNVNIKSQLKVSSDTQSTTTANGALVVSGGVGIAKNLNVGGTLNVTGSIIGNITGNTTGNVTGNVTGNLTGNVTGNLTGNVTGNINSSGVSTFSGGLQGNLTGNVTGNVTGNINSSGVSTFSGGLQGNLTGNVTGNLTGTATTATTANNINISATTSSDTSTSVVLVANQSTGNQSPFIDSGLSYNADTNTLIVPNIGGSLNGNASTSTTFSTNRTNYRGITDESVAGQIMWKNYGNDHTIFDASNSTSPSGTSVNNTNPQNGWTGTYPNLMGWNGSQTYGVRVDSARVSDSVTNGVYTSSFPNNFSGTGYQKFPGGFTIQWGTTGGLGQSSQYQAFATPFAAGVFSVQVTPNGGGGNAGDKRDHWVARDWTLNGFTLTSWFEEGSASYSWIAIGV
jgi:hypothetical protein